MEKGVILLGLIVSCVCFLRFPQSHPSDLQVYASDIVIKESTSKTFEVKGISMTSGYGVVDADLGSALFYWYFDATKMTSRATIIWLTGGPGCSSSTAAFGESMAPVLIGDDFNLYKRANSWSDNYGVLYIDNPIGVGYSTWGNGESRTSANESAIDFVAALKQIKSKNPTWFEKDVYIFGESYAGHYIPAYAAALHNDGNFPELKGIGVGDMWTNAIHQVTHNADYAFSLGLINVAQRTHLQEMETNCIKDIKAEKWADALNLFNWEIANITQYAGGIDQYNSRNYGDPLPNIATFTEYLNKDSTKELVGVPTEKQWAMCNEAVTTAYTDDFMQSYAHYVTELLDADKKVLLYNGADDIIVNTPGWDAYIDALDWSQIGDYKKQQRKTWRVGDQISGYWRQQGKLVQLIVNGAGHMVPENQPTNSREMIRTFIEGLDWQV